MVDALQSEIALLKDLYHPNIVQYLGELSRRVTLRFGLTIQAARRAQSIYPCKSSRQTRGVALIRYQLPRVRSGRDDCVDLPYAEPGAV
jgi:hypothetical protein